MTTEGDAEARYYSLLFSANKTLEAKEKQLSQVVTGVVICGAILFVAWLFHEDAWQAKLDRALSDCLTPLTDGTCLKRDPAAYR